MFCIPIFQKFFESGPGRMRALSNMGPVVSGPTTPGSRGWGPDPLMIADHASEAAYQ